MFVLLLQAPWDRRTARAALVLATGAVLAVTVVAAVDSLSPESTGNWTTNAITFITDLASKDSTSKVTRELEWVNAYDVWKRSPIVGLGIGYAYPSNVYLNLPDATVPDAFYLHNSYMNILAKCGAAGLGALLYLIWRTVLTLRHIARRPEADLFERIVATALTAAFIQVCMLSLTMPVLTAGDAAAYFGMVIGIAVVLQRDAVAGAA
jgi:O-antigen ligase